MHKTIDFKYGKLTLLETDAYNVRALEVYGEIEEIQTEFMLSLFKEGDTVVDVGANLGRTVVPLAQKAGQLYCFEPQPRMFELLRKNIEQNDLGKKVTAKHMGLGAAFGAAGIAKTDYDKPGDFGGCTLTLGDDVKVATLDSFNLEQCHFIKVDVEGMESDVLRGAEETIKRCKPILYVENDRLPKSVQLITLIRSFGYEMYWHVPDLFNPNNFRGHEENILVGCHTINMLCVPGGVTIEASKGLRRVVTPYDRETGRAQQLPSHVKPANGWAGIARFGGIGDNLQAASAAGALKRKGLKVEVITSQEAAWQVFLHNPNIDKLSVKTKWEVPTEGLAWQKYFKGRADEYDVFAHLSHSCEGTISFFPNSTQFHWPAHVRRRLANKNFLEMVHDIAGCSYDFGPLFYMNPDEVDWAMETKHKVGERCIAICMTGSRVDKSHPRLPGLVTRLMNELHAPVILLGDPDRCFESAKQIEKLVIATNGSSQGLHIAISSRPDEHGNRAIDWPIRRSIGMCMVSDLVIGPDTGLMWGVAFEQMPKIMLLGHASPENTTKYWVNTTTLTANQQRVPCWPCHQLHEAEGGNFPPFCTPNEDKSGAACISDISIETIMQHAKALWLQSTEQKKWQTKDVAAFSASAAKAL